jgi:integrase
MANRKDAEKPEGSRALRIVRRGELATAPSPAVAAWELLLKSETLAPSSQRSLKTDWTRFALWCRDERLQALPAAPETLVRHIAWLAAEGLKFGSIKRAYAWIRVVHDRYGQGFHTPREVATAFKALALRIGVARKKARPLTPALLEKVILGPLAGSDLRDVRDRAILLLGFAGAFRESEVVNLTVEDFELTEMGLRVTVRTSKTDRVGEGLVKAIPYAEIGHEALCPVRAVQRWIKASGITAGPVFRRVGPPGDRMRLGEGALHTQFVERMLKRVLGPDATGFSGHSLRRGLLSSAADAGKTLDALMKTSGHKNVAMVMGYIEHANPFDKAASQGLMRLSPAGQVAIAREERLARVDEARTLARALAGKGYSTKQIQRGLQAKGWRVALERIAAWVS